MEKIKPMLFTTWKTYSKEQFVKDVIAGIIVAIIALPLSIALALASGVGPEQGIYTAIVAGFVISFLGGSQVQVAGPTAAFATIVAGIVAKNGFDGLVVATVLAGIILILMGLFHFGSLIKFIPYTITTGFTAGIAVTILIGQFKDFCGVTYPEGMATIETMEKLKAFIAGKFFHCKFCFFKCGCGCCRYCLPCYFNHCAEIYRKDSGLSDCGYSRNSDGQVPAFKGKYNRRPLYN